MYNTSLGGQSPFLGEGAADTARWAVGVGHRTGDVLLFKVSWLAAM
jgi:hypothetical protein